MKEKVSFTKSELGDERRALGRLNKVTLDEFFNPLKNQQHTVTYICTCLSSNNRRRKVMVFSLLIWTNTVSISYMSESAFNKYTQTLITAPVANSKTFARVVYSEFERTLDLKFKAGDKVNATGTAGK